MSCCGQRRRALASSPHAAGTPRVPVAGAYAETPTHGSAVESVALRYRGLGAFTQRSPRTGRLYACGGTGATLHVDPADVDALLRTRLFART